MFPEGFSFENLLKLDLPDGTWDADFISKLKPGLILNGTVIKNLPSEGTSLVRFGKNEIALPASPGLTPGKPVTAEVVKVSTQLLVKMGVPESAPLLPSAPKSVPANAPTVVLNLPETLQKGHILSIARPVDIISGVVVKSLGENQSIIQFDGVDVRATASLPLAPGQAVIAKVERSLPQLTLKILQENIPAAGPEKSLPLPSAAKAEVFQEMTLRLTSGPWKEGMKEGQLMEVKVLQENYGNKVLVEMGGKTMEALISHPAQAGKTMTMFVDSLSPELILKSVDPKTTLNLEKAADFIRQFLPAKEPMNQVLDRLIRLTGEGNIPQALKSEKGLLDGLRQALSDAVVANPEKPDPPLVQKAVAASGQGYEAALKASLEKGTSPEVIKNVVLKGDLKGELLKLQPVVDEKIALLKGESPEIQAQAQELRNFGNAIRSAVSQMELSQVINVVNNRDSGSIYFQVPYLAAGGEIRTVEVFVRKNEEGKEGKGGEKEDLNLTLLLDMSALGNVRADVNLQQKSLHCRIVSQDQETAAFIEAQLPELESGLKELGYAAKLESVATPKEKFFSHVISEKTPIQALGILDVKV